MALADMTARVRQTERDVWGDMQMRSKGWYRKANMWWPSILLDNHIWGLFQPDRTRTVKPTLMWLVWVCFICTLMKSWAVSYLLNNRIHTKAPAEQEEKWLNKLTSQIYSCKMNYMMIINNKYAAKIRNNLWMQDLLSFTDKMWRK